MRMFQLLIILAVAFLGIDVLFLDSAYSGPVWQELRYQLRYLMTEIEYLRAR